MSEMRILIASDIHNCHQAWFADTNKQRMEEFVRCVTAAKAENAYDATVILGDVSLDFWAWCEGGSYLWDVPVSNTKDFMDNISACMPQPVYIIPGNHEQYSHEDWRRITGQEREQIVPLSDNVVFVLLDSFSGDLGPTWNSDGTYQQVDCSLIRKALAEYPDAMIFLGSHFFDMPRESDEFKALLASEDRIKALFMGHEHLARLEFSGDDAGNKPILHTGHFSYSGEGECFNAFRGWRELLIHEDGSFESWYYVPAQTFKHYGFTVTVSEKKQDYYKSNID